MKEDRGRSLTDVEQELGIGSIAVVVSGGARIFLVRLFLKFSGKVLAVSE